MGEVRHSSTHSKPRHWMEVTLHFSLHPLCPGETASGIHWIERYQAGPNTGEKSASSAGNRTLIPWSASRNLVTTVAQLSWLLWSTTYFWFMWVNHRLERRIGQVCSAVMNCTCIRFDSRTIWGFLWVSSVSPTHSTIGHYRYLPFPFIFTFLFLCKWKWKCVDK
jgi:hypothetical protein